MIRGFLLGLLGVVFVSGLTYFNDSIVRGTSFLGTLLPTAVYGALLIFLLVMNPLLHRFRKSLSISGRDLAIALGMTLVACAIPSIGLMANLTPGIILPHHFERTEPGWEESGIVKAIPKKMLVDPGTGQSEVLNGFVQGMSIGRKHIGFSAVPWAAWGKAFLFWIPFIVAIFAALVGLAIVVHKQWSDHEHLPYPIAVFSNVLLPDEGHGIGALFRNRLFLIALVGFLIIHLSNYLQTWFPNWILIPRRIDLTTLKTVFPTMANGVLDAYRDPFVFKIFFSAIAIAYLIASDVAFSIGIGPIAYTYVIGLLAGFGYNFASASTSTFSVNTSSFLSFGAYLGVFLSVIYTGRHYYTQILKESLFLSPVQENKGSVWAARVFLVGTLLSVFLLSSVGLDWQLSLVFIGLVIITFLVMGRTIAESGVPLINCSFYPVSIVVGLFGARALGIEAFIIMALASIVIVAGSNEGVMLYLVNALKMSQLRKVKAGRTGAYLLIALLVGLAVAIPVTLYFQYDSGFNRGDQRLLNYVLKPAFNEGIAMKQRLVAQGNLEFSESVSGWRRFLEMTPNAPATYALGAGLVLVLLTTAGRLRFPRFPLHPILFLLWGTSMGMFVFSSFLLGWLIKLLVTKYGGHVLYQRVKPFMFGLIAADLLGGVIPLVFGFVYYLVTGDPPKVYLHFMQLN